MNHYNFSTITATLNIPSPITSLVAFYDNKSIRVECKRDDLIHPVISGNKWRKLSGYLAFAEKHNIGQILTFGGAYSNHVHATAYAAKMLGLHSKAIIRGERVEPLNPTLRDVEDWGTELDFVSRQFFREQCRGDQVLNWTQKHPDCLVVPEGGSGALGEVGLAALASEIPQTYDYIVLPVATGTTMTGLINADFPAETKILGICVVNATAAITKDIQRASLDAKTDWMLLDGYHGGGYAKVPYALQEFCASFNAENGMQIEPIYSGKAMFALKKLIDENVIEDNSNVLFLHTGGLQGARE